MFTGAIPFCYHEMRDEFTNSVVQPLGCGNSFAGSSIAPNIVAYQGDAKQESVGGTNLTQEDERLAREAYASPASGRLPNASSE